MSKNQNSVEKEEGKGGRTNENESPRLEWLAINESEFQLTRVSEAYRKFRSQVDMDFVKIENLTLLLSGFLSASGALKDSLLKECLEKLRDAFELKMRGQHDDKSEYARSIFNSVLNDTEKKSKAKDPNKFVSDHLIDMYIQLISRCQWRLELAREQWQFGLAERCASDVLAAFVNKNSKVFNELKNHSFISFDLGWRLIRGSLDKKAADERLFKFLKEICHRQSLNTFMDYQFQLVDNKGYLKAMSVAFNGQNGIKNENDLITVTEKLIGYLKSEGWGDRFEFFCWFYTYKKWWYSERSNQNRDNKRGRDKSD